MKCLTIKEAAQRLGVTPQTIRNWVSAGKLQARRHPINGYRLFDPADVEKLVALTMLSHEQPVSQIGAGGLTHDSANTSISDQIEMSYESSIDADLTWLQRTSHSMTPRRSARSIRIADAFCGGGIFSLGIDRALRDASLRPEHVFGIDFDEHAISTFAHNFTESRAVHADVLTIANGPLGSRANQHERAFRSSAGAIDILVGGPPCQGHSDLNNHTRRFDPKNELYFSMVRLAELLNPKIVIIENVPGVIHDSTKVVERTEEAFSLLGYYVTRAIIELDAVGVPQRRKRLALVASSNGPLDMSTAISRHLTSTRSVSWAISDLLHEYDETSTYKSSARHSPENQRRIRYLFENDLYELPNEQRPPCHRDKNHSYVSVYGRMKWSLPAPTITGGFGSTGQGRFVHPLLPRTLTPHEACRLQFIPDLFTFPKNIRRRAMQQIIGNAAPPRLSQMIVNQAITQGLL